MARIRFVLAGIFTVVAVALAPRPCTAADTGDAAQVEVVRLWTAYRDAKSFARLGQFRARDAEPGDAIILRSQPEQRDGFYFTVRLRAAEKSGAIPDGEAVLHVVATDEAQARKFTFPFTAGGERSVQLLIGLTGTDWKHGETMPLAWNLEIVDRTGRVVGGQQSFLWRKP